MWEVGAPTLERPFGVHLWPIFDSIFTSLAGFSANDWDIQEGVTPLTRKYESIGIILAYYLILFVGQRLMKDRRPIQLPTTFMIHNLVLTIVSLVLASLYIEQQVAVVVKHGVYYSVCAYDGGIRQPMQVLSYVSHDENCVSALAACPTLTHVLVELHHQIRRTVRYPVPCRQEETPHVPSHLPPRGNCIPLLSAGHWGNSDLLATDYFESHSSHRDVLLLLPQCKWCPRMVEAVGDQDPNHPVHYRLV